jgi:lysozyme
MNKALLEMNLRQEEGMRLKPYLDTHGKLTIGVGRNLDDLGINEAEVLYMLNNDMDRCGWELDRAVTGWRRMNPDRQAALCEMNFQIGLTKLLGFKKMLAALLAGDWETAAKEALDSTWGREFPKRAERIANTFLTGDP